MIHAWYILAGVVILAAAYYGVPFLAGRSSRALLGRRAARAGMVALTFDDGPGRTLTCQVLDALERHGARATFFVRGRSVEKNAEVLRRVLEKGHQVCSHGHEHLNHWKVSPLRAIRDVKRGWRSLDAALGNESRAYPFRPPEGKLNLVSLVYLWLSGARVVYWTVDSGDTWTGGAERDCGKVADALERYGGAVALYHDFDRRDASAGEFVIESLELALQAADRLGLECVTVEQLLAGTPSGKQ